ncbi:DUF2637 domain-containing protein [Actinoplanes sp. CA-131856]
MTAPTTTRSAYPATVEELLPKAIELTKTLGGELPSRNRLMKEFKIGGPKASDLLIELGRLAERDQNVKDTYAALQIRGTLAPRPALHLVPETPDAPEPADDTATPDEVAAVATPVTPATAPTASTAPATPAADSDAVTRLKRLGWAVRAVFVLGIAASLAGNVLHADDNMISRAVSAWSPLALLLTVDLISRVPARRGIASVARLIATGVIAGIAAWVSYWHMVGVAVEYGETGASPYLLPLSVDGLIVVASISLVEIGGRIRSLIDTKS